MCATHQIQFVLVAEFFDFLRAKYNGDAPVLIVVPAGPRVIALTRVGPQQVAHETFLWHICWPLNLSNLVHIGQGG